MGWWWPEFDVGGLPSMADKVVIITGCSSGIGLENARQMASKGAHVIMACRSEAKTVPLMEEIRASTANEKVEFAALDLLDLQSVADFGAWFLQRNLPLHILLNNAGIAYTPFGLSKDGLELQMQTNHLAPFMLTHLLLPALRKASSARIVFTASLAHEMASVWGIPLEHINDPGHYQKYTRYSHTKLANIYTTREFSARLAAERIYVNCNHPGVVATEIAQNVTKGSRVINRLYHMLVEPFLLSPHTGSLNNLYLCACPDVETQQLHGVYMVPHQRVVCPRLPSHSQQHELWDWTVATLQEKSPVPFEPAV